MHIEQYTLSHKKHLCNILLIALSNVNRFSKLFHWQIAKKTLCSQYKIFHLTSLLPCTTVTKCSYYLEELSSKQPVSSHMTHGLPTSCGVINCCKSHQIIQIQRQHRNFTDLSTQIPQLNMQILTDSGQK